MSKIKQTALQQYTKSNKLYGQNEQQILDKFVQYSNLCSDPMNIFKYMEEKSICIYLSNYWCSRALLFADMGDFKDAVLCLKEAASRNHIVNENEVKLEDLYEKIRRKMVTAMKRLPPKGKRSVNEYNFMYQKQGRTSQQTLESLIQIFQKNYKQAKKDIEKQFSLKQHGKNKSWMFNIYEQNQENIRKVSEKMKSVNTINSIDQYLSMRTPISKKDPMRLTKTMDSIQMLKKKKSTQPKANKKKLMQKNDDVSMENQNINNNQEEELNSSSEEASRREQICMNTTPVGRQLSRLHRRVTFGHEKIQKIQKIRADETNKQFSSSLEKHEEDQIDPSKSISKRGSILKNKHVQNIDKQMEDMHQ